MSIVVITTMERNKLTGRQERVASHGVDLETGKTVILPSDPPPQLGARFDRDMGEWVLP